MLLPNRHGSSDSYRYGYQGSEKDDEIKGEGNSYTTHFRQYDPRVARWLSLDPLSYKFPHQSPYVAMDNNPISYTDRSGLSTDPPTKGAVVRANSIASDAINKIGNNARKRSSQARGWSWLLGLEGAEKQHTRALAVEDFITNEVGKVYDEGTKEYAELFNLSVSAYEESAFISKINPKAYEEYNSLLAEHSTIEDKFYILANRSLHAQQVSDKFAMSGLILAAYAAAYPGGGLANQATNKSFSYIPRYATAKGSSEFATVGRWMSQVEFGLMKKNGFVVESKTGTTHVTYPANPAAFSPSSSKDIFVTFKVPKSALKVTNSVENREWAKMIGPNSLEGRLSKLKGSPVPQMPKATDIKQLKTGQ